MAIIAIPALAQTPQPFPRAGQASQPPRREPAQPAPTTGAAPAPTAAAQSGANAAPTAATLGVPVYPGAQFLASYDAGRGQRYYIFGATAAHTEIVLYYRTQLMERGDVVFREPPTTVFEVQRFREETMAFPPGVTVKDWTWGGSQGYPNPILGGKPARFPTIIMIVPPPPAAPAR